MTKAIEPAGVSAGGGGDDEDVPAVDETCRVLFQEVEDQLRRLTSLSASTQPLDAATLLRELIEMGQLVKEVVLQYGDVLIGHDQGLAELEDDAAGVEKSALLESDAKRLEEVLQANIAFVTANTSAPGLDDEKRKALDELLDANKQALEYVKEITVPDGEPEDGEEDDDDEEEEEEEDKD